MKHLPALLALLAPIAFAPAAAADALDDARRRGTLVWGADQEGGGPYVFPDPADPQKLIGFEVDLAALVAAELGVRPEFKQADWNTLPSFLEKREIDVILNGYEWTPQRAARMAATRPYYIYELQLLARDNDPRIQSWEDLKPRPGEPLKQVSVLGGTAAAAYLHARFEGQIRIVEYDGNTNAMLQVQSGAHDATFEDLPIAVFYRNLPQGRGLRFVGAPVSRGYYVMFAHSGETRLVSAINAALDKALNDGRLRTIYERYHLWNDTQNQLATAQPAAEATGSGSPIEPRGADASTGGAVHGWDVVTLYGGMLVRAARVTLELSLLAMPLAMVLGLAVALGRTYGPGPVRAVLGAYVEVLRGTPVMLQLYVIYFILPRLWQNVWSIQLDPMVAAIVGLGINYSAYEAEIYRAGLAAIPRGQMEAALALGMSKAAALRRVIVPQALRIVVPPVTNDFIALFKDTSICSVISVVELTKQYNMLVNNTGAFLELAGMTALLYMAMSYPLSLLARRMEARLAGEGRVMA